jgi:hypothetical protein
MKFSVSRLKKLADHYIRFKRSEKISTKLLEKSDCIVVGTRLQFASNQPYLVCNMFGEIYIGLAINFFLKCFFFDNIRCLCLVLQHTQLYKI